MVASVSHDIRTPLTALTGQLETIKLKAGTLDQAQHDLLVERAMHNAEHLKRLTDSLAEVSRLDSPEFKAEPQASATPRSGIELEVDNRRVGSSHAPWQEHPDRTARPQAQ